MPLILSRLLPIDNRPGERDAKRARLAAQRLAIRSVRFHISGKEKDEALLAQFGDQLDRLTPGKDRKLDFRTLRDVLGTDTDDTTETAAKEFGRRHGWYGMPHRVRLIAILSSCWARIFAATSKTGQAQFCFHGVVISQFRAVKRLVERFFAFTNATEKREPAFIAGFSVDSYTLESS